jgi:hypothetical protein
MTHHAEARTTSHKPTSQYQSGQLPRSPFVANFRLADKPEVRRGELKGDGLIRQNGKRVDRAFESDSYLKVERRSDYTSSTYSPCVEKGLGICYRATRELKTDIHAKKNLILEGNPMEQYGSFARSSVVTAATMFALLICCQDVRSQEKKAKKDYHPPAPEKFDIGQGLPGPDYGLNLSGALPFSLGGAESTQGGWGKDRIQTITGHFTSNSPLHPSKSELERFGTKQDLTAGEALEDDTWNSPLPPLKPLKSSSVILEIPISWTGTGTGWTGAVGDLYTDGDTGVYSARVEDCLTPDDHTKLKRVNDKDDQPIKCKTADGVQGRSGYWYDVGDDPWSSTKYLSLDNDYLPGSPGLLPKKTIKDTLSIPVNLPAPVNSLRVEIELGLKDSHCDISAHAQSCKYPTEKDPYVQSTWGSIVGQNSSGAATARAAGGPEFLATRFAIQLPNLSVLPAAFMEMKVLPYTILYRPPGDQSQGTYATTASYGTTMTTGNSTAIDNTSSFMDSWGVTNSMTVTDLIAKVQEQDTETSGHGGAADYNATVGTGLVVTNSHSRTRQWQLGSGTTGNADPTILPAARFVMPNTCTASNYASNGCAVMPGETYFQEPFWEDRIVVLLNPTAELWNLNGGTKMQLLGAQDYDAVSIKDLAACAQSTTENGWKLINGTWLTPKECVDLIQLDPYWMAGQSFDPAKSARGVSVGQGNYGEDPRNPTSTPLYTNFQDVFSYTSQQSTNTSASYQSSVTNMTGFSWSDGLTLGGDLDVPIAGVNGLQVGISGGATLTQGTQKTTGTQMKVNYSYSTAANSTDTTQISGTFGDDHDFDTPACQKSTDKCYTPRVKVYVDMLFGSYMFSDPDAPPNPITRPVSVKTPLPPALISK